MPYTEAQMIEWRIRQGLVLPRETGTVLAQYKDPLMPSMTGYGFYGCVSFNVGLTHTQCHLCGYFFKGLGMHIRLVHEVSVKDYRRRFSLMASTSLVAPTQRRKVVAANTSNIDLATRMENLRKGWGKSPKQLESMEQKNIKGRCPEQLLAKVQVLAEELKKTPTRRDFIKKHGDAGDLKSIYRTFGSWNGVVRELGLPPNRLSWRR